MTWCPPEIELGEAGPYRSGRLKVRGGELEVRTTSVESKLSGQATYSLTRSHRDWGHGWVPWANDRLHQLRLQGMYRPSSRTSLGVAIEMVSGQPFTPFLISTPASGPQVAEYGPENSARGDGGIRMDLSVQRTFAGPFGTAMSVGLSVANIGLGDQAPREASSRLVETGGGAPSLIASSKQLFTLPPVPSLLIRIHF